MHFDFTSAILLHGDHGISYSRGRLQVEQEYKLI